MLPVNFEGANILLEKPANMTDDECSSVPAYFGEVGGGFHGFIIAVQPNKEDLEAMNAGRPVYIKVLAAGFPPMEVFTTDSEYNPNN